MARWLRALIARFGLPGYAAAAIVLVMRACWLRRRRTLPALGMVAILLPLALHLRSQPHVLTVTFLNVGKGDAMVAVTPSGRVLVLDTGSRGNVESAIIPYLRRKHIRRIDELVLTHPHPDHVGGAAELIERIDVGLVTDNGARPDSSLVRAYRDAAARKHVAVRSIGRGASVLVEEGLTISVLGPPDTPVDDNVNNSSLVLKLEYGKSSMLLTGDIRWNAEQELLKSKQPLKCDLLKVAHHGSASSSSDEFLQAAMPAIAVISVDSNNQNGYPSPAVLQRLNSLGARILRTDRDGDISIVSDGSKFRISGKPD